MANLALRNVCKSYPNGFHAVKDFNLDIRDGEFIIFVGPSGCGKSTTLRMIAGLEDITSGELWIDDQLVNFLEPKNRDLSMVFQNYALYPHMSVYDNMAFSLKIRKMDKKEISRRVHEAARLLEIEHLLDRKPGALSGGQKQRLCIARALLKKPKILILDDSTSAVDTATDAKIRQAFAKKIPGTTKLIVAQRISSVQDADRILVLDNGEVNGFDTHENLLKTNSIYREIYEAQTQGGGDFDEPASEGKDGEQA